MKRLKRSVSIPFFFISILLFNLSGHTAPTQSGAPDDLVIIVNKTVNVDHISVEEIKQIFLKKKGYWPDGEHIVCIHPPESSKARHRFRDVVLGMSQEAEKTYWRTQQIRNQVAPPANISNTPKAVFRLKNAVSYALRKDVPKGVAKIVLSLSE